MRPALHLGRLELCKRSIWTKASLLFSVKQIQKNRVKCVLVFSRTHMHTSTNLRNVCMRFCWGQSDIHWYFQQCNIVSPWFSRSFSSPSPFLKRRTRGDHQQLDRKFGCNLASGVDLFRSLSFLRPVPFTCALAQKKPGKENEARNSEWSESSVSFEDVGRSVLLHFCGMTTTRLQTRL